MQTISTYYSQLVHWLNLYDDAESQDIEVEQPTVVSSITTSQSLKENEVDISLSSLITYLAKKIFALSCFAVLINNSPYFALPIGFLVGLSAPEFFMEKTARIYASIFQPKEVKYKSSGRIPNICLRVMEGFHSFQPAIVTGTIAFFALPVSTLPIITGLVALRLGAYIGMNADTDKYKDQWLYTDI